MTTYTFRVLMPDPEKLTPELLSACRTGAVGYVLEVEVGNGAMFVGVANVPTLLDILGGSVGGPVAYAFLEDDKQHHTLLTGRHKRWFISVVPGIPWAVPGGIQLKPAGVSATAGVLNGHFELVRLGPKSMDEYLEELKQEKIIVMPSRDYTIPTTVLDALKLGRK